MDRTGITKRIEVKRTGKRGNIVLFHVHTINVPTYIIPCINIQFPGRHWIKTLMPSRIFPSFITCSMTYPHKILIINDYLVYN